MIWTLSIVAGVVVVGLIASAWVATRGGPGVGEAVATSAPTAGPSPSATPVAGSEVQPPTAGSVVDQVPARPAATPRIAAPLPASGSLQGGLVDGFPAELAGPLEGSTTVDSSIAGDGTTIQVTLVGRTAQSPAEVIAAYEARWSALGLVPAPSAPSTASYSDAFTSLTVGFSPSAPTGTLYTVYGVLRTE